jgi:beta-lactam-binding protein with PASTA domain
VVVPNVVGMYEEQATKALTDLKFNVNIKTEPLPADTSVLPEAVEDTTDLSDVSSYGGSSGASGSTEPAYEVGQVMRQDPAAGDSVNPRTVVTLTVAIAPVPVDPEEDDDKLGEPTEVPDLLGLTKSKAEYAITTAGFKTGLVDYENSDKPIDTVIAQSPKGKEMAAGNSKINIVISLGPKAPTIKSVAVDGGNISKTQGSTIQFTATVQGTDSFSKAVKWSISGGSKSSIDSASGLMTIGNDEPVNTKIVVTATSAADSTKSGSITVTVTARTYTLTVTDGSGSGSYTAGTQVPIVASVKTGYNFTNWSSNNGGSFSQSHSQNTIFTMPAADVTVKANYTATPTYTVTVVNGMGGGTFEAGASVTITAGTAPAGQIFNGWSITGVAGVNTNDQSITFPMPAGPVTATANFIPDPGITPPAPPVTPTDP